MAKLYGLGQYCLIYKTEKIFSWRQALFFFFYVKEENTLSSSSGAMIGLVLFKVLTPMEEQFKEMKWTLFFSLKNNSLEK